jgi:hypothetical protein
MSPAPESEWATRKPRIDPQLTACRWGVKALDPRSPAAGYTHQALTEFPTANGPADSALVASGRRLGVVGLAWWMRGDLCDSDAIIVACSDWNACGPRGRCSTIQIR